LRTSVAFIVDEINTNERGPNLKESLAFKITIIEDIDPDPIEK
jgi:hypothetical protein